MKYESGQFVIEEADEAFLDADPDYFVAASSFVSTVRNLVADLNKAEDLSQTEQLMNDWRDSMVNDVLAEGQIQNNRVKRLPVGVREDLVVLWKAMEACYQKKTGGFTVAAISEAVLDGAINWSAEFETLAKQLENKVGNYRPMRGGLSNTDRNKSKGTVLSRIEELRGSLQDRTYAKLIDTAGFLSS